VSMRPPRLTRSAAPQLEKPYAWSGGSTRRWRKARDEQFDREPMCADCRATGRVTKATHVHHPHELSKGGDRFDPANMASLCAAHHKARHGSPIRGANSDGTPSDPGHPWNR